ncbi:MAG TPA: NAD(P)/FAD-dependent oxidoreductase [Thermoanaerobaculia bacterium]|jgi:flavin-dependent dehydrogenase|nr:NAD(P)/FAD-dependent oxidoreductase [Thermoanaerobaculia bacterium]
MTGSFDVAVIGAGPAGSTLAALLASRGASVALIDRDAFPRDKLCGEFLSYDALPIVELLGVDLGDAPEVQCCRVVSRHANYEFELPYAARGVSRMTLDDLLFRTAIQNGSSPVRETVTSLDSIQAKVIAGAWGRWGRFDTQLGRRFVRDRAHRNFGFKRHYHGPTTNVIELYSFRRGYLGVSSVDGGVVNICGLVHASRLAGHKGRWDAFVETIRAEEPTLDALYARHTPAQEEFLSSEPVIFRGRSAVEAGVFMIGDASGVIDPLTGNGMAMAMQSALLAAPLILRLLQSPRDRTLIEDEYRQRHHAMFAPRIRWSRAVARLLSNPWLLDVAMRSVRSRRPGELFLRHTRAAREQVGRMADAWRASAKVTP